MRNKTMLILLITIVALTGCITRPVPPEPTVTHELATPLADSPAAGICAEHEGSLVTVIIYPDIPDPRCSYVRSNQHLRVVNMRSENLKITLARLQVELAPGNEYVFQEPFGALLMPGVHRFSVEPCCGAELVLSGNP